MRVNEYRVNEDVLSSLLAPDLDNPSPVLAELMAAKNPEYQVLAVRTLAPFDTAAERTGRTAGSIYLRLQNEIVAVAMSDNGMLTLAYQIQEALDG